MSRIAFRNFTGGEVTPTLSARYDLQKFGTFLRHCENFLPNLHGDIERRPGTVFLNELAGPCVTIPFQYNTEPENNYALLFCQATQKIYVADRAGLIAGVEMVNPYTNSAAYQLSIAQAADVLYIAHPDYALRKITRSGASPDYAWAISTVTLNQSIAAPGAPTVTWHRGPKSSSDSAEYTDNENYTLAYVITAVGSDGVESVASAVGSVTGRYPTDWVSGDYVQLSWTAVQGAAEYNVYRDSAGYYGFIGVAGGTSFQDQNYEADTATTPKKDWNPFANGNNPATVAFHQQRMVLGGGKKSPASFYMSRVGDFENFRKSTPSQDDDPVEYMIASGSIDDIKWVASFGDLVIGTSGAEYKVSSAGAAITPSDVQITTQSYWGSAGLQPMIIGNSVIHAQRADTHVRDLYYSWETDGYAGNDLSLLAPQLVETHKIRQWCFQQSPGSNIWMVREDGVLLCLTYMQEQKVYGWSTHVTDGEVLSVCSLCGADSDEVLLAVKRTVNGTAKCFLERLAMRFRDADDIKDAYFVDCGKTVTPTADELNRTVVVSGLSHLEGMAVAVLADGSPEEEHIVTDGRITLYYPAEKAIVGIPYKSVLSPMPIEGDLKGGSSLGKARAYGKCVLRLYRSVGGKYAATNRGDLFDRDAWEGRDFYDVPFIPEIFGEACQPFSGDVEIVLPSGQDNDTSIWLMQDRPLPFRLVALAADVVFGEQ